MEIGKLLSHNVSQNAIANAVRTILQVFIGFFGSYVLIHAVPATQFGAWALSLTISSFIGLVDIGMAPAVIKFTAAHPKKSATIFWTSLYYYGTTGFIAGAILVAIQWIFRDQLFKGFVPSLLFMATAALGTYIGWYSATVNNVLNGLQLMKRTSSVEVFKSILFYACIIPLIPSLGLYAFPLGFMLSTLAGLWLSLWFARGKADLQYRPFDMPTFRMMIGYGVRSYGMQLTALFKSSYIKLVASQLFNLQFVAYVEMSQKIGSYIRQMYSSINSPLLPASSSYESSGDKQKIRKLFWYSQTVFSLLGLAGTLAFIPLAPFLVNLWLGPTYQPVIFISVLECISIFANMLLGPAFTIYQGMAKFKPILYTFSITTILMLILLPLGGKLYGLSGIYYGFIIAEFVPTIVFF